MSIIIPPSVKKIPGGGIYVKPKNKTMSQNSPKKIENRG